MKIFNCVHKSPGAKTEGVATAAQLVVCALLPPAHPHGTLLRHSPVRCLIHTHAVCFLQGVLTHSDSPGACGVTVHHLHLVLKANPVIDVLKQLLQATDRIQPSARCELD